MKKNKIIQILTSIIILFLFASGCDELTTSEDKGLLHASGVVEAIEVNVSSELGGRIADVYVNQGDKVEAGDRLFRIEDDLFETQRKQAITAFESAIVNQATAQSSLEAAHASLEPAHASVLAAEAAVETAIAAVEVAQTAKDAASAHFETANAGLEISEIQYELELINVRLAEKPTRAVAWEIDVPKEFEMPIWYFKKSETISAAEGEIEAAEESLAIEEANLESFFKDALYDDLRDAEIRLVEARAAFLVAEELRDRKIDQKEEIDDFIQTIFDAAKVELEAAQLDYEQMLSDQGAKDMLEARARLSAAHERQQIAIDFYNDSLTGEESPSLWVFDAGRWQAETLVRQAEAQIAQAEANVALAQAAVGQFETNVVLAQTSIIVIEANIKLAETGLLQAEKSVAQAEAAIELIDIQIEKLTVHAAVSGVVMTRNIQPGEVIQPGRTAMTLGQLENLSVTVYIPEDKYGQINLGDTAFLSVDSFPEETFNAHVNRIADRAEYTPRNVQTQEERRSTVFAIELSVEDPEGKLKPGMPSDVEFNQ